MSNIFSAKKIACSVGVILLIAALVVRHFSGSFDGTARAQLLRFVPAGTTSAVFIDVDELRSSPFLAALYSRLPEPAEDSEYTQFVRETGFDYARDLNKVFIATSDHGTSSNTLVLAEGRFDRQRIESFLERNGGATNQSGTRVFTLRATRNDQPLSVALLSGRRIAVADSAALLGTLWSAPDEATRAEWQIRFDRLAGSPTFAVLRQDPALAAALDAAAPGGFRSPQLAAVLGQLRWISIAAKPDGPLLRLVAEGECPSSPLASELSDFLQGIQVMAQNGLNDPQLRRQMNADERQAYLDLLKSADVEKIDRGESKSVRLVLSVTPQLLSVANLSGIASRPRSGDPAPPSEQEKRPRQERDRSSKRDLASKPQTGGPGTGSEKGASRRPE